MHERIDHVLLRNPRLLFRVCLKLTGGVLIVVSSADLIVQLPSLVSVIGGGFVSLLSRTPMTSQFFVGLFAGLWCLFMNRTITDIVFPASLLPPLWLELASECGCKLSSLRNYNQTIAVGLTSSFKTTFWEGEAPAEPLFASVSARQEPRPPGFETGSTTKFGFAKSAVGRWSRLSASNPGQRQQGEWQAEYKRF